MVTILSVFSAGKEIQGNQLKMMFARGKVVMPAGFAKEKGKLVTISLQVESLEAC